MPFTAAKQSYRTTYRELISKTVELTESHQVYILHRMARDQKTPQEEKLKEARRQCEAYGKAAQASKLLGARAIRLMMPKGPGGFDFLIWSSLALIAALILLTKFRPHRA